MRKRPREYWRHWHSPEGEFADWHYNHMKTEELRNKDIKELKKSVLDLTKKLSDLRFKFSANQLKNVKEIHNTKKEIARMLTIINEKTRV